MTDDKVIPLWDRYKPRKSDDTTTAIRRLLLRRRFKAGERVHYYGNAAKCGTVTEASDGVLVRVLWDHATHDQLEDVLDVLRVQNL
jgi:hypothetical protein